MRNEKIEMSPEQKQQISSMLHSQGLSPSEINVILNGKYEHYDSEEDLESSFGELRKYGAVLEKLSDGYTMDELEVQGISPQKIDDFNQMLSKKNITIDNAKAIYQYSVGSNMILGVKRGTSKETIQEQIMSNLEKSLQARGVKPDDIEKMKQFVKQADYDKTPLHECYDNANREMENRGLQQNSRVSVLSAMQSMYRCAHIDETIASLEEGLGRTNISKSMVLYRAINSSFLEEKLGEGENLTSLIGRSIDNKGQTSTSPLYDSSFASLDECDCVFEIYTPKGSRGAYIAELSAYDKTEQEVLLNPNDLYIISVQTGFVDKNGKTKIVLKALCLSKDIECYRGIDKEQSTIKTISKERDTVSKQKSKTNLLAKQNKFLRFFAQMKSGILRFVNQMKNRFLKKKLNSNPLNSQNKEIKPKRGKKTWNLNEEQRTRVQKGVAKVVAKHVEQEPTIRKEQVQQGDIPDILQ